ncbi:2,3-bisphosphoglycerate-dependent phosphoglycerate mutase [Streptomyces sp. NPDC017230]|uniref:2,3-bisphosphoglycerate-dependent phosphoglycerate mutase n=1 Tax=unclassified Streptomyces TaxID=2593676 RepID=UPI0037998772
MSATLILLRHGESTANAQDTFTGWTDVHLTSRGRRQAQDAGRLLHTAGPLPDVVHTSLLRRTITTADIVLDTLGRDWIPVSRTWRLNERHCGALTGLNKAVVRTRTDEATYHAWRRSWATPSPPASPGITRHPPALERLPLRRPSFGCLAADRIPRGRTTASRPSPTPCAPSVRATPPKPTSSTPAKPSPG